MRDAKTEARLFNLAPFLAALLIGIQLVPVDLSNPPVEAEIDAPEEVLRILERSCYDCHSNETSWPWYSRIAPVSWLVAHDVREGREHLNFSQWRRLGPEERAKLRDEIREVVEEGEMPLWFYLPLHPEARLRPEDRVILERWAVGSARGASQGVSRLAAAPTSTPRQ